jgi:hypothetical protein
VPFSLQRTNRRSRSPSGWLRATASGRSGGGGGAFLGRRFSAGRRPWQLDAGPSCLRETDGDRLFRRARAMLALADVKDLLADELAGLGRGRLSGTLRLTSSSGCGLFGHLVPPAEMTQPRCHLPRGTATCVALAAWGLLLFRTASSSGMSVTLEFLTNCVIYVYLFAVTASVFLLLGYVLGRRIDQLRRFAMTDAFTGLPNRRAFQSRLRDEWTHAKRRGSALSILLIDIDGLKRINDEMGHAVGQLLNRPSRSAANCSDREEAS